MKKIVILLLTFAMVIGLSACGNNQNESKKPAELNIAYQYGLAYAPLVVAQKEKYIEKAYTELTGEEVTVNWIQMNSGADINTGIVSGELNVGFMGVGPAITGVSKNVGYKIFTNLSGQEHGLMVNDSSITSLSDLVGSDKQIAVVNIGSIQHIMLAMALENEGLDAHALDENLVVMKHPDGMAALVSGNVSGHVTSSPYIFSEHDEAGLHEIEAVKNAWTKNDSFIVGVASEKLYEENVELYEALRTGISDAMEYVNENTEEVAKLTYELDGNSVEEELSYLQKGSYGVKTSGILKMAQFMYKNGFIENELDSYDSIVFKNVTGD